MLRFVRFAAGILVGAIVLAVPFLHSHADTGTAIVSVIVEFKGDPAAVYAAKAKQQGIAVSNSQIQNYRNQLTATQNQFLSALSTAVPSAQLQSVAVKDVSGAVAGNVPLRYSLVYNGVALTLPEAAVPTLAHMSGVKAVHPNSSFQPNLFKSVPYIRATQLYGKNPNDMTPFGNAPDGNEGQGEYIAVIDTGIDWTHPMFGGDPTPPRLGIGLNSATVPANQKVVYSLPLADIVTDGFGHGTHVASEAAGYLANAPGPDGIPGTADDIPIHGVAPQAKLMSYKVCSDSLTTAGEVSSIAGVGLGGCFTSNIIMGIEDAVSPQTVDLQPKPIANVINMSLGGGGGPDEPTAVAADNATLLGCSVVAAAGNSGPGEATVGAPAAGRRVLSPAANTDPGSGSAWSTDVLDQSTINPNTSGAVTPAGSLATASGQRNQIILYPMAGTPPPPSASEAQYCVFVQNGQTLADWPTDVSGRIALVKLINPTVSQTLFAQVANNGAAAGAIAVIFVSTTTNPTAVKSTIPAANILPADGQYLESLMPGGSATTDPANGAMSSFPLRLNPFFGTSFMGEIADFSSRGPVEGYGQIKPDVSAPGVNILAAAPQASVVWALSNAGPLYAVISGTSMATPHTSGSVALVRQAHPEWSPDMVRTAMINAATNMRDENGAPKPDASADNIISQGGGLIDVYHAATIKALMGTIENDGKGPFILGSHSYGEVPVVNNRMTTTQSVTVTIQDLSGQGGTYNLGVAANQDVINGVNVTTNPSSVNVPAGGSATFTVNTTFDGSAIRDPNVTSATVNGGSVTFNTHAMETQWYITAQRSDGGERLRMPFYYKPIFSLPQATGTDANTSSGTVAVGDLDLEAQPGVDYVDVPVNVDPTTFKLAAELDYFPIQGVNNQTVNSNIELDLYLLDPNGNRIAHSTNGSGAQRLSAITLNQPGTYTLRVDGNQCAGTNFTLTATRTHGNTQGPALQTIAGDFVDAQNNEVDFDGNFSINWTPNGGEQGFEIEQSNDNNNWNVVADVSGSTTSFALANQSNGTYYFRVRAIYPGQIGQYVSTPGNVSSVVVSTRTLMDITSQVSYPISNVSLTSGVWQQDVNLVNNSTQAYVPLVDFKVVGINSASGTVRVINADNGGNGQSAAGAALFDFSGRLGSDQIFSPNETTGARTVRFQDSAAEMFTWDVQVTAYVGSGSAGSNSTSSSNNSSPPSGGGTTSILPLTKITAVMRFTVNPLTKTVTSQLIKLN